jgi:hypothetical protein
LYELAARAGVSTCRVNDEDTAIRIEYAFRDGATLRATRNLDIEYSDQQLRLASPLDDGVIPLLARAEQSAFGEKGCGIDWRQPETKAADDDATLRESIYRGNTCNCQARTRADAAGRVVMLSLRSAC